MRTLLSLVSLAGLAACAHRGAPDPAPQTSRVGIYRFTEHPPQSKQPFQGRVGVTNDTVVVETESGPCLYDPHSPAGTTVIYHCGDITVSFNRTNPVLTARYTVNTTVTDQQATCARRTSDSRQTCIQQRNDPIERQVPVTGTLHLELVIKPD